jgi:ribosomal protein S27AE
MTYSCHACGRGSVVAQVSDHQTDICYWLCARCLYGAWPPLEERKARLLAELGRTT